MTPSEWPMAPDTSRQRLTLEDGKQSYVLQPGRIRAGGWRLAAGGWRLAAGDLSFTNIWPPTAAAYISAGYNTPRGEVFKLSLALAKKP